MSGSSIGVTKAELGNKERGGREPGPGQAW
jgi:hypothetical protein